MISPVAKPWNPYTETLAGIRERAAAHRDPPAAFRAKVEAELEQARRRALLCLPIPTTEHVRIGSRWGDGTIQTVRRTRGRCVGCGCDLDDRTPGCANCGSRHAMRARSRENACSVAPAVLIGDTPPR